MTDMLSVGSVAEPDSGDSIERVACEMILEVDCVSQDSGIYRLAGLTFGKRLIAELTEPHHGRYEQADV